ncbi:MAG: ATP:cob(I)alamin adenosyltransferase [Candidatus Marinimicrobia bacterium]|nr:ATP:cob(I)alamin adenosyltransferase [Candidatus Neomarinimicrobiota bacterium]|tara:strand:- start:28450 stop:29049 length:600 start_codon:yes stop_codon:yes gene_type:complete
MKNIKKPKIIINKVYTKTGDKGMTSLIGGKRVLKSNKRVSAYGQIDELNVAVGSCLVEIKKVNNIDFLDLEKVLIRIQNELFNLGNMLAMDTESEMKGMPQIDMSYVNELENNINFYNKPLSELNSFVLPGGNELSIRFHLVRVKCRKVERFIVKIIDEELVDIVILKYLNRLSDLFFVLSRYANFTIGDDELTWNPNC